MNHDLPSGFPQDFHRSLDEAWNRVRGHGDYGRWQAALSALPALKPSAIDLDADAVRIGDPAQADAGTRHALAQALQQLHPWRKGPFSLFGLHVDCEWRSDMKWRRLCGAIAPLSGRRVLDVGCGSGYHLWRMRGAGAASVTGIDPTPLYAMQFAAVQHYLRDASVQYWPLGIDDMPEAPGCFDTVFSMGLLYHRRAPIDHLLQLKGLLRPGGELVLETLIVAGDADTCLVPSERYAKMRNVWFIPSAAMLEIWLERAGFSRIRLVDACPTGIDEQRRTDWMRFESLADFLDAEDAARTVEGYPAPVRAVMLAERPR
jgi:tRNA (mo5U34)-methyltransferase